MNKPFWQSKTIWFAIITAIAGALIPGATDWIKDNPEAFTTLMSTIFIVLRIVTKGKVYINPNAQ